MTMKLLNLLAIIRLLVACDDSTQNELNKRGSSAQLVVTVSYIQLADNSRYLVVWQQYQSLFKIR